jgi:hypothetical protein
LYAAVRKPITLKLGNKTQIPAAIFRKFLILPCHGKSNRKIRNPDPLEALFKKARRTKSITAKKEHVKISKVAKFGREML